MADEQTPTPTPEDLAPVAEQVSNVFNVILGSLARLESALGRTESAMAMQTGRMDTLVNTTNHRLDDFRDQMQEWESEARRERSAAAEAFIQYQGTVSRAVEKKLDRTELVTDVLWKNRAVQFGIVGTALVLAPVVYDHWALLVHRISGFF